MAARFKTRKWTLTGGADSLSSIVNSPNDEFVGNITLRASKSNAGDVTWEDSDGEDGGYLEPSEAASFDLTGKFVKLDQIFFVGTATDILHVTVIG